MTIRTRIGLTLGIRLLTTMTVVTMYHHHELIDAYRSGARGELPPDSPYPGIFQTLLDFVVPLAVALLPLAWVVHREIMRPVERITLAVRRINENNLRERIELAGNADELDRLAGFINEMMERLDSSFSRVREFTLDASHELKTPLTVMRGQIEVALKEAPDAQAARELLHSHLEEIRRMAAIVDALSLLAKADSGRTAEEFKDVDLGALAEEAVEDASILGEALGVVFVRDIDSGIRLHAAPNRLRQLLLNLLDNATKYNVPGGRVVVRRPPVGAKIERSGTNTRPGITPEHLPRVFNRFFRCDRSRIEHPDGSGLGLAICEWIVKLHGGEIRAESADGVTTFTVTLPAS